MERMEQEVYLGKQLFVQQIVCLLGEVFYEYPALFHT